MAYDEDLANRVRAALADESELSEMQMFGGLAFLISGHMVVSASGKGGLLLRVDPDRTDELTARAHAARFVMRGREMDGWLRVAPEGLQSDRELREWVEVGLAHARSLPPRR